MLWTEIVEWCKYTFTFGPDCVTDIIWAPLKPFCEVSLLRVLLFPAWNTIEFVIVNIWQWSRKMKTWLSARLANVSLWCHKLQIPSELLDVNLQIFVIFYEAFCYILHGLRGITSFQSFIWSLSQASRCGYTSWFQTQGYKKELPIPH
jgi:hypothetical protein